MSEPKLKLLSILEQLLARPGMWVGSVEPHEYDKEVMTMTGAKRVTEIMTDALLKIIEEPLANAADASQGDTGAKNIKVWTDKRDGSIKIMSNTKFKIEYIPEGEDYSVALAVSRFMTGTNFDDDDESFKLGQHGIGVKATNALSQYFEIVVHDPSTKQMYRGIWTNNMRTVEMSVVKKTSQKTPSVEITFIPDFPRFGLKLPLTDGQWDLINSQVFDLAVTAPKHTTVYLNEQKIAYKGIKGYIKAFLGDDLETIATDTVEVNGKLRLEVGVTVARDHAQSIVYVNGAHTTRGTIHDYIYKIVAATLSKKTPISPAMIKNQLFIVGEAWIPNARFTSQSKEELYTPVSKFGFKWDPQPTFIKALAKTDLYANIIGMMQQKEDKKAQKDMKVGKNRIPQFAKYDAPTQLYKKKAELILTEGDSAGQLVVAGRAAVKRSGDLGIYRLRGKLMNTSKFNLKRLAENKEVSELIQILGITPYKKYDIESASKLPYRHIILFTDQDVDGSHIAGLCIQLIMDLVPTLLDVYPDYIKRFASPILKIMSGKYSGTTFYTEAEYYKFLDVHPDARNAKVKYYKGLGTSTAIDAKQYFDEWSKNVITILSNGQEAKDAISLAFNNKLADMRKEFLSTEYNEEDYIDYKKDSVTVKEFIYKDMMHYSNANTLRAIPKMLDGQKVSQRKAFFYAIKHVGMNEVKVAQMAGSAAQITHYHHGEVSLANAIIEMAATYTGSSNLPLLYPSGQFGSRHSTDSAAAPRYIFTQLSSFVPQLFRKEDEDVLKYNIDENAQIEPSVYIPVIPVVLVNGANGIGTGWSTYVPQYNPFEVIDACKKAANGTDLTNNTKWVPWYAGHNGDMVETDGGYLSVGKYTSSGNTITVTELPVKVTTDDWIESIKSLVPDTIKFIEKNIGPDTVEVKLTLSRPIADPIKTLKLSTKIATNRMWLFNPKNRVTLYDSPNTIINAHAKERLKLYEASRVYQIEKSSHKMDLLNNKIRYITEFREGKIKIINMKTTELNEYLAKNGYTKSNNSYRYLTDDIATGQLTTDNVDRLKKQIADLSKEVDSLRNTSPSQMWLSDLKSLKTAVEEYLDSRFRMFDENIPKVKKAKK